MKGGLITWVLDIPVLLVAIHMAELANLEYRADPSASHPHSLLALLAWIGVIILALVGGSMFFGDLSDRTQSRASRYDGAGGIGSSHCHSDSHCHGGSGGSCDIGSGGLV